ncbi:MAG: hypothetical protein AAFY88_08680, partial [Acidobacteriota bacterium]
MERRRLITEILRDLAQTEGEFDDLVPAVYDELRTLARSQLRRLRAGVSQRFARRFRSKSGGLHEPVVVDRLHKGAVVGALSMLTKKKTLVEYKCETAVMAVYLE